MNENIPMTAETVASLGGVAQCPASMCGVTAADGTARYSKPWPQGFPSRYKDCVCKPWVERNDIRTFFLQNPKTTLVIALDSAEIVQAQAAEMARLRAEWAEMVPTGNAPFALLQQGTQKDFAIAGDMGQAADELADQFPSYPVYMWSNRPRMGWVRSMTVSTNIPTPKPNNAL